MSRTEIKGLDPIVEDDSSKEEKRTNPVQYYIKFSFSITYIFLLTTAIITFIESIRTASPTARHVLNLETAISIIAAYFYSVFLNKISVYEKEDRNIDWADMTANRYIDWSMTTPLMLLALCIVLSNNIRKSISLSVFTVVIVLNCLMLYFGYLGEVGKMTRSASCLFGFIAFAGLFGVIYSQFVRPVFKLSNYVIFGIFMSIWMMYGLVYLLNETYKNIAMNILDCLSKCCFGLGLWAYYSKIIVWG